MPLALVVGHDHDFASDLRRHLGTMGWDVVEVPTFDELAHDGSPAFDAIVVRVDTEDSEGARDDEARAMARFEPHRSWLARTGAHLVVAYDGASLGTASRLATRLVAGHASSGSIRVVSTAGGDAEIARALDAAAHGVADVTLIGASDTHAEFVASLESAARDDGPLVLEAEEGLHAEPVARAVHGFSSRSGHPFVVFRCDEGAGDERDGDDLVARLNRRIEAASQGTLFVDAVDALSPDRRARVLDALTAREGKGGARVVVVTRAGASAAVADRAPRAEGRLTVPPLRDRQTDVPLLAAALLPAVNARIGASATLSRRAVDAMQVHRWPRNLAELDEMIVEIARTDAVERESGPSSSSSSSSSTYRVPVRRELCTLTLSDGSSREGTFFFPPSESTASLFDRQDRFVPVDVGGVTRLLALSSIAVLEVREDASAPPELGDGATHVNVTLLSGVVVSGELRFPRTGGRGRALDFLNDDARTIVVREPGVAHLVAKAHIQYVEETTRGGRS